MSATPGESSIEVTPPSTTIKRPLLVWVILAFYQLSATTLLVKSATMLIGPTSGQLDVQGHAYTTFDYLESAGFVGLKLYAAIMLFRLRRIAVKLFLATLVLNVIATGYDLVSKGLPPPGGPATLFSLIIGFGIFLLVCLYAWRLERRHVLTSASAGALDGTFIMALICTAKTSCAICGAVLKEDGDIFATSGDPIHLLKHLPASLYRLVGLVVLVVAIGFVALVADEESHIRATFRAMDQAGYGEQVVKRARHSHCPLGEASFAFLSQGGRLKYETTGYVCTRYFGTASIHDGPLDPDEGLDWD